MNESTSRQIINILIAVMIFATIVLSYFFLSGERSSTNEGPILVGERLRGVDANTEQIISLINELDRIDLSSVVIERPDFASLVDISVPIVEEPAGVSNPFTGVLP